MDRAGAIGEGSFFLNEKKRWVHGTRDWLFLKIVSDAEDAIKTAKDNLRKSEEKLE